MLQWRSLLPTSSEILKLLLFIANPVEDFTNIIKLANEYIFRALLEYDFIGIKYSTIALSSLLVVLEQLGYQTFHMGIVDLVNEYSLPFDIGEVL